MNKMEFAIIWLAVIAVVLMGTGAPLLTAQQSARLVPVSGPISAPGSSPMQTYSSSPALIQSSGQTLPSNQTASANGCQNIISYSAKEYQAGWERAFKIENRLSDSEFDSFINVTNVSLRPVGNTCELTVGYTIKKDWFATSRRDVMTLGVPPTISPNMLPLESDPNKPGRLGVSTINLHDKFAFKSEAEALEYFLSARNLSGVQAKIFKRSFQYFWDKEESDKSHNLFAGKGGEAFIEVVGTINTGSNKCFQGELSLVSKETTYRSSPCSIN
jgi:hypothetical protein